MSSPRTAPPPELYEHLARYLAGTSPSGARLTPARRAAARTRLTATRPELRERLDRLIWRAQHRAPHG